jgi:hypothetical protein
MKVCEHQGWDVAVVARNVHCPPHVQLGAATWEARFEFGFWHGDVRLLDAVPGPGLPPAGPLEALRQALGQPELLRRARAAWWRANGTVCMVNKLWDVQAAELVPSHDRRSDARRIEQAVFDAAAGGITRIKLAGEDSWREIRPARHGHFDEPVTEFELNQAIERGRNRPHHGPCATSLHYLAPRRALLVEFGDASAVLLPAASYPELAQLTLAELESMRLGLAGSALCLPARDLHLDIVGLLAASRDQAALARAVAAAARA